MKLPVDLGLFNVIASPRNSLWSKMGKKIRQNSNLINHFPTSEGVSEVSERVNE